MKSFSNCLANAGVAKMKSGGSMIYQGIALKSLSTLKSNAHNSKDTPVEEDGEGSAAHLLA